MEAVAGKAWLFDPELHPQVMHPHLRFEVPFTVEQRLTIAGSGLTCLVAAIWPALVVGRYGGFEFFVTLTVLLALCGLGLTALGMAVFGASYRWWVKRGTMIVMRQSVRGTSQLYFTGRDVGQMQIYRVPRWRGGQGVELRVRMLTGHEVRTPPLTNEAVAQRITRDLRQAMLLD
jgi:hypothetical protein